MKKCTICGKPVESGLVIHSECCPKHAHWEKKVFWNGETPDIDIACSNCGHMYGDTDWKYCPWCGAKMSEEE